MANTNRNTVAYIGTLCLALGCVVTLYRTSQAPLPEQSTEGPARGLPYPPGFSLAADAAKFDVAEHTTLAMEGVVKLLDELDEATPPGNKLRGLKLRLGILQAYLALMTSHLSPEEQEEVRALARELYKLGVELRENPAKGA
jgi:hypothetical protein